MQISRDRAIEFILNSARSDFLLLPPHDDCLFFLFFRGTYTRIIFWASKFSLGCVSVDQDEDEKKTFVFIFIKK